MTIPRLLGGALNDLRTIAEGMAVLPQLLAALNGIQGRVDSLDDEVKRMRKAVEGMGEMSASSATGSSGSSPTSRTSPASPTRCGGWASAGEAGATPRCSSPSPRSDGAGGGARVLHRRARTRRLRR